MNGNVRKKLQRKSLFIVESNNRDHEAHCQWNYKIVKDLNLLKNTSENSSQKVCQFLSRDANASWKMVKKILQNFSLRFMTFSSSTNYYIPEKYICRVLHYKSSDKNEFWHVINCLTPLPSFFSISQSGESMTNTSICQNDSE